MYWISSRLSLPCKKRNRGTILGVEDAQPSPEVTGFLVVKMITNVSARDLQMRPPSLSFRWDNWDENVDSFLQDAAV
jgi:hypothetical protein